MVVAVTKERPHCAKNKGKRDGSGTNMNKKSKKQNGTRKIKKMKTKGETGDINIIKLKVDRDDTISGGKGKRETSDDSRADSNRKRKKISGPDGTVKKDKISGAGIKRKRQSSDLRDGDTAKPETNDSITNKRKRKHGKTDSPVLKKVKLADIPVQQPSQTGASGLTRKQRRNRKKSNKKNKYKHLALKSSNSSVGNSECTHLAVKTVSTHPETKERAAHKCKKEDQLSPKVSCKKQAVAAKKFAQDADFKQTTMGTLSKKAHRKKNGLTVSSVKEDVCRENSVSYNHEEGVQSQPKKKRDAQGRVDTVAYPSENDGSVKKTKTMTFVEKAHEKLNAARFRFLNEQLYTSSGKEAWELFQDDPEAFQVYHQGYQNQVSRWPVNPLDTIIKQVNALKQGCVLADLGCGEGRLAQCCPKHRVHSFDLVATQPWVTACDITQVPLSEGCVDVAVFCLSLMGTNRADYLREANRILRHGGQLKVAEVASRFGGINRFVSDVERLGFQLNTKVCLGKMFLLFSFKKVKDIAKKSSVTIELKPCHYKRR